jgi:hypothetical protein
MQSRRTLFAALIMLTPVFTACADVDATLGPDLEFAAEDVTTEAVIDLATIDRGEGDASLFDELAEKIPGFAGFWFDRACNLHVVLTTPDLSEAIAKEVLEPYLRRYVEENRCRPGATIIVHEGDYTWRELSAWLEALRPAASLPGVSRLGISIQQNRIVVAVDGRPTAMDVLDIAARNDVPAQALKFTLAGDGSRDRSRDPSRDRSRRTTDRSGRSG